jgi:gliding motility-associated-like protein
VIATYLTCIERDTVHIVAKPLPVINITGDSVVCFNDTVHLFASGGVDYQWENGLTGDTISYVPTINDTISLTVINSYSCTATDSVEITVHPLPIPTITGDTTVCMNDTLQLEADGGAGFLWSNNTADSTIAISQNTSGFFDYFVVATDTNSCSDTAFQTIEVFPLPVFFLGNDTTLCQGNTLLLQVGFINANFLWSTSDTTANITVNTPNDYSLLVTDSNSCLYVDTINVAVIPYADATIDSIAYVCENNPSFPFTAAETGGVWSGTGITNNSVGTYDPAVAGVGFFSVYYTIGGFCGNTDSTIIEIAEVPSFSFVTTNETCAGANDGTLIISASGGATPYTFILDTILISDTATNLAPHAYNLFVLDTRGCVETDSVFIIAEDFPCGEMNFYIPNIFSPNGDGSNDVLYIRSNFIDNMKFLIYDRFGEKVFESTNPDNGWDGKYNGQPVAPGVYHYFISVNLIDGTNDERKGNVTIVR